ncbi:hypothetical protein U5801_20315 [Lamprobacter modestohalophilus]|uniref:hypothetical protein n=1 Tax=Lamprobacter modestohalophilus TaxID=1064514 RepID=UPI002ADEDA22|nr:hypothetical protein [Lamprobacter modestohalophilus]MEA1052133.1 hypothetical protein [Lamprobacter modestohalophilus]
MGNIVITTGYTGSGWSVALASLAPEQFVHPVPGEIEDWRAQAEADAMSIAPTAQVIERLQTWSRPDADEMSLLADERDLRLLDHWAEQLPNARFLLFFTDPETALAHAIRNGFDPSAFLEGWRDSIRHLTGFQRRYRARTLLLDAASAHRNPTAMIVAVERLGLRLALRDPLLDEGEVLVVERLIARRWLANKADLAVLRAELEAHAYPLAESEPEPDLDASQLLALYRQYQAGYQQLIAACDEQTQRANEQAQQAAHYQAEAKQYQAEAEQNQATAEQHKAEADKNAKALDAEKQRSREREAAHQDAAEENELLLLQLHQVQEELESLFLKGKEAQEAFEAEKASLIAACDEQTQRANEQAQQAAHYQAEAKQNQAKAEQNQAKAEQSQAKAKQYQAEAKQNQATAEQHKAEADKNAKALDAEKQRSREREAAHQDTAEENELLLLQLHQVQEELEQYFLKYQELVQSQQALQGIGLEQESAFEQGSAPALESAREQTPQALPPPPKRQRRQRPAALKSRGPFAKNRKERRRLERYIAIIRESGLFDESWYLSQYPDVADAGYDPIEHFVCHGVGDKRNPAPWFDTAFYLETHPDVSASIMNPLVHYHQFGKAEQRPTRRGW